MEIFITKRAKEQFSLIQSHLKQTWGENVAEVYKKKTSDFLDLLTAYPKLGAIEFEARQIRGFQLTKHTRIFYRIKKEKIIILAFFDVRQDPLRKPKE